MTSRRLARHYLEAFRNDPIWSLSGLIARVKDDFSYTITKTTVWRAKNFALKLIVGDEELQYGKLHDYKEEILRTNPGSTVQFKENKGKKLKDLVWNAPRATYIAKLDMRLDKIEEKNAQARQCLRERPCENWSKACFKPETMCNMLTNNLCECFNRLTSVQSLLKKRQGHGYGISNSSSSFNLSDPVYRVMD
ncbi:hypothetical protein GH714_017942 [Hevea brasiliensis]|uniref:Uncharacterized protein n=1 Tax=Hevea brasiliensis TaxID=3981 RepID=A0A6A6LSC6_HEVBR|nr:hypothetical protein GH714_017942 [Hevea brasiliensis]